MRNEPLVEITQIKGTSEVHPSLAPNDEWANFEIMERYIGTNHPVTKFKGGYVREALKDGILMQETKGFNPFKMGFIGSSDTHNAAPGSVEERNYFSKVGRSDGTPAQRGSVPPGGAKSCRREARFTWSPTAVGSAPSPSTGAITAIPELTPARMTGRSPNRTSISSAAAAKAAWNAMAVRHALRAASSCASGTPNTAITLSPAKPRTEPPCPRTTPVSVS